MAYLVLLIAVLSRVLPALLHTTGGNVTAVGAALLFFGASLHTARRWHAVFAVVALAVTDWWLTTHAYGYPFHVVGYLPTWAWYAAVCLGSSFTLTRRNPLARLAVAAIAAPTGFFLISNFVVFLRSGMYPHTTDGLVACYVAAVPFYRNDLVSTAVFTALFFLLPATESLRNAFTSPTDFGAAA